MRTMQALGGWAALLAALLIGAALGADAQAAGAGEGAGAGAVERVERVAVALGGEVRLACALPVGAAVRWTKDGAPAPADLARGELADAHGLSATLSAPKAQQHHRGLYRCAPGAPAIALTVGAPEVGEQTATEGVRSGGAGGGAEVDWDRAEVVWFEVRGNLSLDCGALASEATANGAAVEWRRNGTLLDAIPELKERVALAEGGRVLAVVARARADDFGNWSCAAGGQARGWRVLGRPHARLEANAGVVEGQRLKLVCKLVGKPHVPVDWLYTNDTLGNVSLPVEQALAGRVQLLASEQGVPRAELLVEAAARTDAGRYECVPRAPGAAAQSAETTLRVKDMYAALWPFLGIVAEVVVLCAVILVYERRRAQPELDDSDTDNHDAKKS